MSVHPLTASLHPVMAAALTPFLRLPEREPMFMVDFDDQSGKYPLGRMLQSNSHDTALCAWLRSAQVGDVYRVGTSVRRVA